MKEISGLEAEASGEIQGDGSGIFRLQLKNSSENPMTLDVRQDFGFFKSIEKGPTVVEIAPNDSIEFDSFVSLHHKTEVLGEATLGVLKSENPRFLISSKSPNKVEAGPTIHVPVKLEVYIKKGSLVEKLGSITPQLFWMAIGIGMLFLTGFSPAYWQRVAEFFGDFVKGEVDFGAFINVIIFPFLAIVLIYESYVKLAKKFNFTNLKFWVSR